MNGVKRVTVRRSAEEWRAIVSRFERSGKTSKQFCSAEQLTPSTIALWRRRLRGQAAGSGANGAVRGVGGFAAGAGGVGGGAGLGRRRGFSFAAPVAVLNFGGDCRIWLYTPACDMRRSFDGRSALVRTALGADPTNGHW